MGQQVYEASLRDALGREAGGRWAVRDLAVLPMRAPGHGGRHLPLRAVWRAPYPLAAAVGSLLYSGADVVHRLDLRCPPGGRRQVVTVHDLAPSRFDDEGDLPPWAARSARAAARVVCSSHFAADELRDLFGVRDARVIPCGLDVGRFEVPPFSAADLGELGMGTPLVVHAGGATRRKNLAALAAAWPAVLAEHPDAFLALCGPPDGRRDALFAGLARVRSLGFREPAFVARLMRSASVVVVPSTYEGFGLPALEGMAAGAAVVAAACGALPEVCGDAARLVEPSAEGIAGGIAEALAGGAPVDARRAKGLDRARSYSWGRAARETLALYEDLVE